MIPEAGMADYSKAAFDLKARLNAKARKKADLTAFFENVRVHILSEVEKANVELVKEGAPKIDLQQASPYEATIEIACRTATCIISQDRSIPSISAVVHGELGDKTIAYRILCEESPIKARKLSDASETQANVDASDMASTFVEELIMIAP
jgi:hypothetical protein